MLKNLTKGWKTTLIGLVIFAAAIASVLYKGISWSDAVWGIAIGLGLLFAPDDVLSRLRELLQKRSDEPQSPTANTLDDGQAR